LNSICIPIKKPLCAFSGCYSGSRRKDHVPDPNIQLHNFPKDNKLREIWLKQIEKGSNIQSVNFETGIKTILL